MSIEIHCPGCGKGIHAPDEAGGKRAKCPACGYELYIPLPPADLSELPLAPEDTAFLQHEAALLEERRRLDRQINRERDPGEAQSRRQAAAREAPGANVQSVVIDYLRALSRSDLAGAEQLLPTLKRHRTETLSLLDRLAADQMPPTA